MNTLSLVEKIACLASEDKEHLEWLVDRFLAHSAPREGCGCHVIDPKKSDIIIWPSSNEKHPNDLIVKVTNQKFIGMPRIDKRGMKYWKVRSFYEDEESDPVMTQTSSSPLNPEELELLKSYQEKKRDRLPLNAFSLAETEAYRKWKELEKVKRVPSPENVQNQENHANN